MKTDRIFITTAEAISLLPLYDSIHTFRSSSFALIGADWSRKALIDAIKTSECEIGGEQCKRMGHGLVVHSGGPLFVEVDKDKLQALEDSKQKSTL